MQTSRAFFVPALATGAATLYRNTTGDATRSLIGGSAGPSVRDIAESVDS